MNLYLYGPPGSGKSTLGGQLASTLDIPFIDLDDEIVRAAGQSIEIIFSQSGEAVFRALEQAALKRAAAGPASVVALGGGALLDPQPRAVAEASGVIVLLNAALPVLQKRLTAGAARPLLAGDLANRLAELLQRRAGHYQSFPIQIDTSQGDVSALLWEIQRVSGAFRVRSMGPGYDVRACAGLLPELGAAMVDRQLSGPVVVVTDQQIAPYHLEPALESIRCQGLAVRAVVLAPGEETKTITTVQALWQEFLQAGIERGSTIVALGGGVVGDLTGFAAATYLRGVGWVNVPTTLLAMVDSSLGGKTGVDLPQAKNLVGAFHPPRMVWADPALLRTLPEREARSGMAEVVKHAVIADRGLIERCAAGFPAVVDEFAWIVPRAAAVKVRVIEADPFERGLRQALNFGHTIGHGVELASNFSISHGEAVAIGMVCETRLAERAGIANAGLADQIEAVLKKLGLPTDIPQTIDRQRIIEAVSHDKKRAGGRVTFALPVQIGEVRTGVIIEDWEKFQ